jgi:hypothetical protein
MSDTKIEYDDKFGIETFKREITGAFGEQAWRELTDGGIVPDIETEHKSSFFKISGVISFGKPTRSALKRFANHDKFFVILTFFMLYIISCTSLFNYILSS